MKHLFMFAAFLTILTVCSTAFAGYNCYETAGGGIHCENDASERRY